MPLPLPVLREPASPGEAQRRRVAAELQALDVGDVRFSLHERLLYATDASMYQAAPIGVVCPRSIADAQRLVAFCGERGLPMLPRGAGTSLAGQTVNHAVVIDFSPHCRRIIEVDAAARRARVESGVVLDQLNAALAPHGLMFGPDVATSAQANIGGMIGNNSAGAYSILYGRTVEHVIGLDAMLADGARLHFEKGATARDTRVAELTRGVAEIILPLEREVEARFPKITRRVDGYNLDLILAQIRASTPGAFDRVNLAHLLCGSEGTLAVTLEATLNLVPAPRARGLAIVSFAGVDEALGALATILSTRPAAVELIDDVVIGMALRNREYARYVELLPPPPQGERGAVMYVAYFADEPAALRHRFDALAQLFPQHAISRYDEPAAMEQAWKLRKAGEPLLHGVHGPRRPVTFIEDTAVDPQRLVDFISDFRALVARHGTSAAYYAHASVGCLHIRPLVNIKDPDDTRTMQQIAEEATDLVMRYGGAVSGEHGDGRVRTHLLERFYGPAICDAFRRIKRLFDPNNLLNPGNIVDPRPEAMITALRVRPHDHFVGVPETRTFFRYEREHGFGEAVEMCNGAGVCRKMHGGTMCPSYRGTLDERHATRGRGNALRLAITGQLWTGGERGSPGRAKWNDDETNATLDLCLSCKACKSECPSNVDIAKLKAEYAAQSFAQDGGPPLSARIIASVRAINRVGSAMHPLANLAGGFAPLRALTNRLLGFHPRRAPPRFEQSIWSWLRRRARTNGEGAGAAGAPAVVLFADCFTAYNETRIARAAVQVLEALGYRVVVPRTGCCGRSHISTGWLSRAPHVCRETARALLQSMDRESAIAVVACEPSCLAAIKDEWLELEMGMAAAPLRELAATAFMVEEFIEARWSDHPMPPRIAADGATREPMILHGHCHQKALWGIDSSASALRRIFGERLGVLDSGCCGMAGQWGYMRHHYDLSMRIFEQSLGSALRERSHAMVLAPGTSCRQQIHDALDGRRAVHPIEAIAAALALPK